MSRDNSGLPSISSSIMIQRQESVLCGVFLLFEKTTCPEFIAMEKKQTWKTVRDEIHHKILDTTYLPGDKLPKDEEIAKALNCARSTVMRAMKDLTDSGIIERKRKGGTRVRPNPVARAVLDIPITRCEIEEKGSVYSHQLLLQEVQEAPLTITAKLALPKTNKLMHVEALHLSDGRPFIYEDRWISLEAAPEVQDLDFVEMSANEWLVRNKPYSNIDIQFYAERAGDYYSRLFDTDKIDALFVIERTTWIEDHPITTVKAVTAPGYRMITRK